VLSFNSLHILSLITTMAQSPTLLSADSVSGPLAKASAFVCAVDLAVLCYILVRHRCRWDIWKRETLFLLVCAFVHLMDAKSCFYSTGDGRMGNEVWRWFSLAVWYIQVFCVWIASHHISEGTEMVGGGRKVVPPSAGEAVFGRICGLLSRLEAPWDINVWGLYSACLYLFFVAVMYGTDLKNVISSADGIVYHSTIA
jgi:hypothetical protein